MDMRLDKGIKDRLLKIYWLSNCGKLDNLDLTFGYTYIKNIKEIEKMLHKYIENIHSKG